jgi:predicted amidophosphoribosyltransferase
MSTCKRCKHPNPNDLFLCPKCMEELEHKIDVGKTKPTNYNGRLRDGFSMLDAGEDPSSYFEIWS